jgi:hypothetical protein
MNAQEFVNKYKDVEFKLIGYYKYTFQYVATTEDGILEVFFGETADDIYRAEFLPVQSLTNLMLQGAGLRYWTIHNGGNS